ncbi:MAG: FAD-dependent oxidoreductase [Planctomycetota bacterium]|nr:MAG: FAD-dependent oxidoreductase [Planctomycetota bacterium]
MSIQRSESYDLVVAGGGLAGLCAAVAAARKGLAVCLVHERPVLGGVASSEMRVTVHGAACHHAYGRETGIIHELLEAERAANHETVNENGWTNSIFDLCCYDLVQRTPGLTLHLNTVVTEVLMEAGEAASVMPHTEAGYYERPACAPARRIRGLRARTLSAEIDWELCAPLFVDCTGDGLIADRAGCAWRMGSESSQETGEPHAPEQASTDTMGNSIHIRARQMGRPCPFTLPEWAHHYDDASFFYEQGRVPHDPHGGYWWIEIGVPWHTIHDNETIRHELTRHALGVWNWMKNHDPKMRELCANFALDFIGQVPGKRESRRIVGRHWLTENELQARTDFPDEICHGGWFVDLHTPGGLLAPTSEPASAEGYAADSEYAAKSYIGPYGIPLRSLIARDVDNLFMAGRCLSATRAALGTVRVMATTALMGQAVGNAAALALQHGLPALAEDAAAGGPLIRSLQQQLLRQGVFLPHRRNQDQHDLARKASASASSSAQLHGLGHEQGWQENGLLHNRPNQRWIDLTVEPAQIIAVDGGPLKALSLYMENRGSTVVTVPLSLTAMENFFDYQRSGVGELAKGQISLPPGRHWLRWELGLDACPQGYVRLLAGSVPEVAWSLAGHRLAEHAAQRRISPSRMRSLHQCLAFRCEPAQEVWRADQVVSGRTRPGRGPECWRSDAGAGLPAWLELRWDRPQSIGRVELTFPGQLRHEVHAEPPFFACADIAQDYRIQSLNQAGEWQELLHIQGNRQRRRDHDLLIPSEVQALRLLIDATGGSPQAALSEIRCYAPGS